MSLPVATVSRLAPPMLWLVVCLLLWPVSGFGQALTNTTLSQFYHQAWGLREGVPGSITSIVQTADGYLWLANPSGLHRFDGVRFERFDERAAGGTRINPSQLAATPDGALWITVRGGGVSRLAGGRLTSFRDDEGVPAGQLFGIVADRSGVVWVANDAGVARFDGQRWHTLGAEYGVPKPNGALFVDRDNAVWMAAGNSVVILPKGASRARPTTISGHIRAFAQHPDGTVWIASADRQTWPVNADGSLMHGEPHLAQGRPLLIDRRGALWRAHQSGGIDRSVLESGRATPSVGPDWFDALDGLTADDVFDFYQDRESNVWVATGGGLDLFRESPLVAAPFPRNAHASRVASGAQGAIWVGGENYPLMRLHQGTLTTFEVPRPVRAIDVDTSGAIWAWADGHLWRGNGERFARMPKAPFTADDVSVLVSDRPGRVLLSVPAQGLWSFSDGTWSRPALPGLPPGSGVLRLSARDRLGRVWLAFRGGLVALLDEGRTTTQAELASLGLGAPVALAAGLDRTWVGLDRGLALVEGARSEAIPAFGESVIGRIKGIVESADGGLWLNSDRGIVQVSANDVQRLIRDSAAAAPFRVFDYLDGGIGGSVLVPSQAAAAGTDGRLWFVGFNSVVTIDPTAIATNPLPPPVHIETLRAAGHEYRASDHMELPVGTTNIQIQYTGLSLAMPGRVRFRYWLEGVDAGWQDAGTRREAFYTNLSPGPYTFRVVAANNDGVWNEAGATLAFVVPPAYYETNAFRAVFAFAAIVLVVLAYRIRVRQVTRQVRGRLEERRLERERIARELHDTLLQGLQGIILKFQAIGSGLPPGDPTAGMIEATLERADRVLIESRDRVQNLRTSAAASTELSAALAQAGDELARGTSQTFHVVIEGTPRRLHPIVRDEAYWIGHEALLNAFHHAGGSRVEAEVCYGAREFRVRCRDNGKGIGSDVLKQGGRTNRFGLTGMRERARRMGGQVDIRSRPGAGTEVELRVPSAMAYPAASRRWWRPRIADLARGRS